LPANPEAARASVAQRLGEIQDRLSDVCLKLAVEPVAEAAPPDKSTGGSSATAVGMDPLRSGQVPVVEGVAAAPLVSGQVPVTHTAVGMDPLTSGKVPVVPAPFQSDPLASGRNEMTPAPTVEVDEDKRRRRWARRGEDSSEPSDGPSSPPSPF